MSLRNDGELVQATLAGDAHAYRELVERHENRIYRFLLRHVMCADEAEDLAQETFLQAYRSLPSFRGDGKLTTWLIGIALNVARNHHNRNSAPLAIEHELDDLRSSVADVVDTVDQARLLVALQQAIASLPVEQRECVTMIALEGLSYEQASEVLGVPIGTIKSRLARARAKLAELLPER